MLAELRGSARGQDATQDALGSFQQLIKLNWLQLRFETLVEVAERMRHFHAAVAGAAPPQGTRKAHRAAPARRDRPTLPKITVSSLLRS